MSDVPAAPARPRRGAGFWGFIALMLGLMALFVALGVWQVERLGEKERLIASVADRTRLEPISLPPAGQWPMLDGESYDFRPIAVSGHYLPDRTVLVFDSLSEPRGRYSGPGYWVMTPFAVTGGGTLFVNRGFVPQEAAAAFKKGADAPLGELKLGGLARRSEAIGAFTPEPDRTGRIEFVRDSVRLAALGRLAGPLPDPVAPVTLDLPAGPPGSLPQGGETVVEFPNNHLGYAMTWFGFALLIPFLLGFWIRQSARKKP